MICPGCIPMNGMSNCKKHGRDFIEFKCKFCCNVAQWYCGGNTHYCDPCHGGKGQKVICQNKSDCPLKIKHPKNKEFPLGCALCRNEDDF